MGPGPGPVLLCEGGSLGQASPSPRVWGAAAGAADTSQGSRNQNEANFYSFGIIYFVLELLNLCRPRLEGFSPVLEVQRGG